ncbi:3414_t:CDS:2, partial [Gigaspora margarita]
GQDEELEANSLAKTSMAISSSAADNLREPSLVFCSTPSRENQ